MSLRKKASSKDLIERQLDSTHRALAPPAGTSRGEGESLRRTLAQYQKLFSITSRLNAEVTTGEALHELVTSVTSIIDVARVSVYISHGWEESSAPQLRSPPAGKKKFLGLVMSSSSEVSDDGVEPVQSLPVTPSMSSSVAGYVAHCRIAQMVENIQENQAISARDPLKRHRNAILVPIIIGPDSECVGVLECVDKRDGAEAFTQVDLVILQTIASSAGNALQKIVLYEQALTAQRKTSALLELANASRNIHEDTLVDVPRLIERLLLSVYRVMHTERVLLYMCDAAKRELWYCRTGSVSDDVPMVVPFGCGIIGMVANNDMMLNVANCSTDPRFDPDYDLGRDFKARTMLATPVRYSDGSLSAVLVVANKVCRLELYDEWRNSIQAFSPDLRGGVGSQGTADSQPMHFSKEDEFVLDSIAQQIGDILERNALDTHYESVIQQVAHLKVPDVDKILTASLLADTTNKEFYKMHGGPGSALVLTRVGASKRRLFQFVSRYTYFFRAVGIFRRKLIHLRGVQHFISLANGARNAASTDALTGELGDRKKGRRLSLEKRLLRGRSKSELYRMSMASSIVRTCGDGDHERALQRSGFDGFCMDVFGLDASRGPLLMMQAFEKLELVAPFRMSKMSLMSFVVAIRDSYLPAEKCPYHNWDHALGVFQMTYVLLLKSSAVKEILSPVHLLGLLVAAVGHDAGHMGRTNDYEVKLGSRLAILYNDKSVLEQHHAATVFHILNMPGNNILQFTSRQNCMQFRKTTIEAILGTDMSCHVDVVKSVTHRIDDFVSKKHGKEPVRAFAGGSSADAIALAQFILHSIDIAGQCYPRKLSDIWSNRIIAEFMAQADDEVALGVEPTPYMANLREPVRATKLQFSFTSNIVLPCWKIMHNLFPCCEELVVNLRGNVDEYRRLLEKYQGESTEGNASS